MIFWKGHVAIALSKKKLIHAYGPMKRVVVMDINKTIERIKNNLNPKLSIRGILLTMYDKRNKLSGEVEKEARDYFKEKVYQTVVPRNVRLSEAPSHGMPVLFYDKSCPGSKSYFNFTHEFINQDKIMETAA